MTNARRNPVGHGVTVVLRARPPPRTPDVVGLAWATVSERRLQRSADVVFDVVVDRAILLDGAGDELITLNAVGTVVWNELDGRRGDAELAADLLDRFVDVGLDELRADIAAFLDELAALGLAVEAPP